MQLVEFLAKRSYIEFFASRVEPLAVQRDLEITAERTAGSCGTLRTGLMPQSRHR